MKGSTARRLRAAARYVVVVALCANGIVSAVQFSAAGLRVATVIAIVICGMSAASRSLPWFVAPAFTTLATVTFGAPLLPLLVLALYDLGERSRIHAAVLCAGAVVCAALVSPLDSVHMDASSVAVTIVLFAAATAIGRLIGRRRDGVVALNREIDHLRVERQLGEERAREAERSRIALEMHDILAHRLSLIALHAGVLETKAATVPEPIRERLALLRTASVDALSDLREVLGALHTTDRENPRRPMSVDLESLVSDAREAGQQVELSIGGVEIELSTAQHLAVQRVVQESLTNARKHAVGSSAVVDIHRMRDAVTVVVTNTAGSGMNSDVLAGFGLVGLNERVGALGGSFDAGRDGDGWVVRARLPVVAVLDRATQ